MKTAFLLTAFVFGCYATVSITSNSESQFVMEIKSEPYGETKDGKEVTLFTCQNANGLKLKMIDYGATVVSLETPDRNGKLDNIVLTCPDIKGFEACTSYFGSSVGRYCNRIANGKFKIGNDEFTLATNNGDHHLHGGTRGWDKVMWKGQEFREQDAVGIRFTLESPDGDEGYPGNVSVTVDYILNNQNELIVDFQAKTDKATHINLTNHNYWNLGGESAGVILDHQLKLGASRYLPVDAGGIPTGELVLVENTPFDFREFHSIGQRVKEVGGDPIGYDHCYALDGQDAERFAALVSDPKSGRMMEIRTNQPGIQFYTGNFLDGSEGSGGYAQHNAFCLETQHFPDAPNQPEFKSTLLQPGVTYHHRTVHRFTVTQ